MSQMIVNIGRPIQLFALLCLLFWLSLMLKCWSGIIYADANDVRNQSIISVDNNKKKNIDGPESKTELPSSAFNGRQQQIWLNLKPLSSSGNYRYYNVNDNDNVQQHDDNDDDEDNNNYHQMPTIKRMANNNISGIKHQTLIQQHLDSYVNAVNNAKNVQMRHKNPVERIENQIGAKSFNKDIIKPIIEKTIKELNLKLNNNNNDNDDNKHYNKLNPFDNDNDEYRLSSTIYAIDADGQYFIDLNDSTDSGTIGNNLNNANINNGNLYRNGKLNL